MTVKALRPLMSSVSLFSSSQSRLPTRHKNMFITLPCISYQRRIIRYTSRSSSSTDSQSSHTKSIPTDRRSITIGDVTIKEGSPIGSHRPDLIPCLSSLFNRSIVAPLVSSSSSSLDDVSIDPNNFLTSCQQSHLRWMLQKDLALQQDFVLLGPPSLSRDRRHLIMMYAALIEREIEYIAISRDTTESDLKQRKEVKNNTTYYVDQAPVRAARHGRLLILDGLEKAERNVLPALNNLLENRELALDDGSFLVSPRIYDQHQEEIPTNDKDAMGYDTSMTILHRVHPDFRVAGLACIPAKLDPPLRSRFQARVVTYIDPGEMLQSIVSLLSTTFDRGESSINIVDDDLERHQSSSIDLATIQELVQLSTTIPDGISFHSVCDAATYLQYQTPNNLLSPQVALLPHGMGMIEVDDVRSNDPEIINSTNADHDSIVTSDVPMTPKPSFVSTSTTKKLEALIHDAFQTGNRAVCLVGPKGSYKSSIAKHYLGQNSELFTLYSDMTARDLLLTRGTDEDGNTVWRSTPLTRAVQEGRGLILDGIDKLNPDTLTSLALLFEQGQLDLPDGRRLHITESFRCIALAHPPSTTSGPENWIQPEVKSMFYWIKIHPLPSEELKEVLRGLYPSLDSMALNMVVDVRDRLEEALASGAADNLEEEESLLLSLRKIKHICKRIEQRGMDDLCHLIHNAMLTSLLPERERRIVQKCMDQADIVDVQNGKTKDRSTGLDQNKLLAYRRTPKNKLLVPDPIFEENFGHGQVLSDILDAFSVGERALLIMGFQGVGKNRVVDYLLNQLQCEREYLQLHRDTTVQSLLASPTVEDNRIVFADSPLVRAAKHGRILVVDEADKAPVEVVALLKGLIEDGELTLPDGRVLRYDSSKGDQEDPRTILIHKDFQIFALANPAGYPFHGNDLAREMADVFSCHSVPALDAASQRRILRRYGPNVADHIIDTLIDIWDDLREAHEKSLMTYPFSVREAVSSVKHLNKFPDDGIVSALENVISFDRFDNVTMKQLAQIFHQHGLDLSTESTGMEYQVGIQGGISTPRTRASAPKHGKIDENNDPHVGGNTWAGGTGGSDTAGLGGRGGPYRLDSGHPVHQVSEEMKAQVTEESKREARKLADEALAKKLQELEMGELDWNRYKSLHDRVAIQIQQLQVMLKDIKRRKQERVWLKRQSTGELDDSRLVDALAGEKDVFKRRGKESESNPNALQPSDAMSVKLVVDISASMYRFNGYDGRLQRLLEATLMIMEALKGDDRFNLSIVGHSGDSAEIKLVDGKTSRDPKTQLRVLESMVAHTQYCFAGDTTLEAIERAVSQASEGDLIIVISDANLQRYHIDPNQVSHLLRRKDIHAHLVLISSFGDEAERLANSIPNERAQVCFDSNDLPLIIKGIVASAAK